MDANKIRSYNEDFVHEERVKAFALLEIAAQLAEIKELLQEKLYRDSNKE